MENKYLGIEIGGTKLQLILADQDLNIIQKYRAWVEKGDSAHEIRQKIANVVKEVQQETDLSGIGVGFGGPLDWEKGQVIVSHQIEGWNGFNIKEWLQELTGVPVAVENDANAAALGEARRGAGQGYRSVFYITLGSGVGGGLVIDNQLFHGANPGEAEVGHLLVDRTGLTVEDCCSGWAVDRKVWKAVRTEPTGILRQLAGPNRSGEARFLKDALEQGDKTALAIMKETADTLGFGLSHVVHLFHPDIIILGGGLSFLGDFLRVPAEEALRTYTMKAFLPIPPIAIAQLAENTVPIGALELIHQQISKTKAVAI
ncbi:ROK family protein [Adhaeribacter rhizoryzae]|uniref:ROK family protein n=1 Tax=Adhaeribacter rhizoryzae TaxID=2607907 RepID=A0A5M6DL77_9BACT|nr:ROK family protein [Adhaeribacter rhizoryzae]KAA5548203.1 ROK family protein [Adhaeribacter rhizoryzae]